MKVRGSCTALKTLENLVKVSKIFTRFFYYKLKIKCYNLRQQGSDNDETCEKS